MHWDINELNMKYNQLLKLYNKENKPLIKSVIHDDMCTINIMRSLYYPGIDLCDEYINNPKRDIPYEIRKNFSDLVLTFSEYAQLQIPNKPKENVLIEDYNKLLLDFLNNYYPVITDLYKKLVLEKRIELNNKKSFAIEYNGQCIYNVTLNEFFLYSRYNNKMFSSHFLPHELGHAYQALTFPSIEDIVNKNMSFFIEVYSTYIEMLFIKYLKDIGYNDQAEYMEKRFWKHYIKMSEYQIMFFFNQEAFMNADSLDILLSTGLSNIFYEDYLKTNSHKMLNEFNDLFKNNNDQRIIKEYSLKKILDSPQKAIKRVI